MGNVFDVVHRDIRRLLRVPASWIIVFGLIFLPPLYAWFNIIGFWDPYGNTQSIHVSIANEDTGTHNEIMGTMNLGNQIVKQMKSNDALGWQFVDTGTALDQVRSGKSYAAIIIPKDFSSRISEIISGGSQRPILEYYVNEKANGIATKITDTGANTVDRQVNNTFVSTVSSVISNLANTTGKDVKTQTNSSVTQTVAALRTAQGDIGKTRGTIAHLNSTLNAVPNQTQQARQSLQNANATSKQASDALRKTSSLIGKSQSDVNGLIASSSPTLDKGSALLSQASSRSNLTISALSGQLVQAQGNASSALATAQSVNSANAGLITDLQNLKNELNLDNLQPIIDNLQSQNDRIGTSIADLKRLNTDAGSAVTSTSQSVDSLNTATQNTLNTLNDARSGLTSGSLPQLNSGLTNLAGTASSLSAGLGSQDSLVAQSNIVLNQLNQSAATAVSALADTDRGLAQISTKLDTLATDLTALGNADAVGDLLGVHGSLDVGGIANFMLSPTVLTTKVVYPVSSYGSGMAPLFTNLSLWVGAFMLVVIMKLEVDDDDLPDGVLDTLTAGQRYWGRWILLAGIAALQGLVTTVGDLLIGVQSVNAFAFIATGIIASLVYISITYSLSVSFLHIGRVLCIALVMIQIPGSSGLYPLEMLPGFFRALSPFFPFTYAVDALRETIGGFYDAHWGIYIGKLLIFAVVFFLLGLVARPHMTSVNLLFAREIDEGNMITTEPVRDPGLHYRLSQAISVLADKEEYRTAMESRAVAFAKLYPKLKHGALVVGIIVPIALAITFSLTNGTKLVALATWMVFLLIVIVFLMSIEMMRDSIARQVRLGTLSDDALRTMLVEHSLRRHRQSTTHRIGSTHGHPIHGDHAGNPEPERRD